MSFCHKCGQELTDDALYCPRCGERVSAPMTPDSASQRTNCNQLSVNAIRGALSSYTVLVAAICSSVSLLFKLVFSLFSMVDIATAADSLYYMAGVDLGGFLVLIFLFSIGLGLAAAIGVWMVYASAANRQINGFNIKGFTLIRVVLIIQLVFACICSVLALALDIIVIKNGYDYLGSGYKVILIFWLFIIILAALSLIFFYLTAIDCTKIVSKAASTGDISGVPYMYLLVYLFVMAALSVVWTFYSEGELMPACLLDAAANTAFGISVLRIRKIIIAE